MDTVAFEDFQKVQLRVARVLRVDPHPNADRLYLLTVEAGGEQRQLVAGLRAHYDPEELAGQHVVVVWNLAPATIRGQTSHGMLLAAEDPTTHRVAILTPQRRVAPGSKVR